jgi:hypothetical protein
LILSTGEEIPRGHSVRARLLILELAKGCIRSNDLSECQRDAREGLYAQAISGFLQWLAGRYDEARAAFERIVSERRATALRDIAHARTPELIANLQAGFELYLHFAAECGAIGGSECTRLTNRCMDALREAAAAQAKHQLATEPTARFISLLRSLLTSGRAHLEARNGGEPDKAPESCGWRRDGSRAWSPLGDKIGWVDGDDVYLDPGAAYRVVQVAGRDVGETLPVSEQTLKKRLREKGLLASVDESRETLTVRRTILGSSKNVLHFSRDKFLPQAPDEAETYDHGAE